MEWNLVKIDSQDGKNAPFVSIGRGKLEFSAKACKLLEEASGRNYLDYKYAQIYTGSEKGKVAIAVKFLVEYKEDSLEVTHKVAKGNPITSMIIQSKGTIQRVFGAINANDTMIRRNVEICGEDMLRICD